MVKMKRRPSRADVVRSLREIQLLWARPPDPEKETAAEVGTEAAAEEKTERTNSTPADANPQRGAHEC